MKETTIKVGHRLRTRRRIMGLTQTQVAHAIGVRFQQVQKYETGANAIKIDRLIQFCAALEVTASEILNGITMETTKCPTLIDTPLPPVLTTWATESTSPTTGFSYGLAFRRANR